MNAGKTILITGASGLVGTALKSALNSSGHRVKTLSRKGGDYSWDPVAGVVNREAFNEVDAVIHLAGEPIAQRWTEASKARILRSRVDGTNLLVREILAQERSIDYISASGINYYGSSVEEAVDECSPGGAGFLARVTRDWEAAAMPLVEAGQRCVFVRTGVVLDAQGGALKKLLPPFKAGVGGRVGSGQQMMSWISLDDLARVYLLCVENATVSGPVNAVAPQTVSNCDFTKALGKVLSRPTFLPLPTMVVKALFGAMGEETILSSLMVEPARLRELDFDWQHPSIETALQHSLRS